MAYLMPFAQLIVESTPELSPLAQVQLVLGEKLLEADCERVSIDVTRHTRDMDMWQERFTALAVFALIGLVIGCVIISHAMGR